ncbi:putative reverse transcriptase, RNA-dependent DNA polymerase, partial [Tanacetum coccineum]
VADDVEKKTTKDPAKEDDKDDQDLREFERLIVQGKEAEININNTNNVSAVSSPVNTAGTKDADVNSTNNIYTTSLLVNFDGLSYFNANPLDDPKMPNLEDTGIFGGAYDGEDFVVGGDMNNFESSMLVSPIATTRVHKDHPVEHIIIDLHSTPQTRRMTKNSEEHGLRSLIQKQMRTNHKDFQNCLFACFLSQVEPKKVIQALIDPSWIKAMQDELLQFKLQKVWTLLDLPYGKMAIGTKWVYRNKKDERCIIVRNKARLVAQGYTQEEGIDYDDVFALIEEEVYVCQPLGFEDPEFPDRVYKVEKTLYGLHQAPRARSYALVKEINAQNKYVDEILKKFGFSTVRIASTPMETSKPLLKDAEAEDVDNATTGGCQFLRSRLISWQCKKQTVVANSTTEAENLDPHSKKFLMYPRFLPLFLNNKIENLAAVFNDEYDTPSYTKKVFANMRRKGKDFLGTVTPLFATMLIQSQAVEGEGSRQPTEPQYTPTTASPSHFSGPTTLIADETVHEERGDSVERATTTATSLDAE